MVRPGLGAFLRNIHKDFAVGLAARIFAVGRLIGVVCQILSAELVGLAVLHTTEAGEVGFSQIVGGAVVGTIFL